MNMFKFFLSTLAGPFTTFCHVSVIQYQVKESENSFRKHKCTTTIQHLTFTQLLIAFNM